MVFRRRVRATACIERERDEEEEEEEDKKEINFIYQRHRSLIPRRSNGQLRNRIILFR